MVIVAIGSLVIGQKGQTHSTRVRDWIGAIWVSNPLVLPVCFFAAAYFLATVLSIDRQQSLWGPGDNPHGLITVLCGVAFFLLITHKTETRDQIDSLVDALLLGSIPVAVYGLAQYLGLDALNWIANPVSPTFSTMGNPNYLGAYLGMLVPFTLSRIVVTQNAGMRLRYGVVVILQVVCLWLTLARGAWLGLMGGCLSFLLILSWRWRSRTLGAAFLISLLLGVGLFVTMNNTVLHPWSNRLVESTQETNLPPAKIDTASIQERIVVWRNTASLIMDRWVLGYGPGTFAQVFTARYPSALVGIDGPDAWVDDPHNFFLLQLTNSGIIGLLAFLWIVASFYQLGYTALARNVDPQTDATLAAIAGSVTAFLIQAQFNPVVIVLYSLFWLDLAIGVAVYSNTRAFP